MVMRLAVIIGIWALAACGGSEPTRPVAGPDDRLTVETLINDAAPGDTINLPAGVYSFDRPLRLLKEGITLSGAGMDKTRLTFRGQIDSPQADAPSGILAMASGITIEDLAIEDAMGTALVIRSGGDFTIRRVRIGWTDGLTARNGWFGMDVGNTDNTVIEGNVVSGASKAGIHITGSRQIIVRENRVEKNITGMTLANNVGVDVIKNTLTNNAVGVALINEPAIGQTGSSIRILRNLIRDNNLKTFWDSDSPAGALRAGTGIIIQGHDHVEIFENEISGNRTANVLIESSVPEALSDTEDELAHDPYAENIFIHDNALGNGGTNPDGIDLQSVKTLNFGLTGALPDILWDGVLAPARAGGAPAASVSASASVSVSGPAMICVDNGSARIMNLDAANGFRNPDIPLSAHDCHLKALPPVEITGAPSDT